MNNQFHISQRLALLRTIMQRADLSATAKTICWLLLLERMNSQTGKCVCSNTHIADQLGIGLASVKRAKLQLAGKPSRPGATDAVPAVLTISTPAQNEPTSKSEISSYRFLIGSVAQNEPTNAHFWTELKMSPAQNQPTSEPRYPAQNEPSSNHQKPRSRAPQKSRVIPFRSTTEIDALERHERETGERLIALRDKSGNIHLKPGVLWPPQQPVEHSSPEPANASQSEPSDNNKPAQPSFASFLRYLRT